MRSNYLILFLALTFSFSSIKAADAPFHKGVNLTNWFQVGSAQQIQFSKYSKTDFEQIQSLGCDVVRLPINLHFMTNGAPDYTLDPLFLTFLDEVISWTEELGMNLILDNHTFDSSTDTDPKVGEILLKVWPQMAQHYLNTSTKVFYEVLNEPHGISDVLWNKTQQQVIDTIRTVDTKHTIIVGPASWNSYNNLDEMPAYNDNNLIYTFHFYDPFLFTHQGAGWSDMTDLAGIPFPHDADRMPEYPASMAGHWSKNSYNNYSTEGTVEVVHKLLDIAIAFAVKRNVPIYCGEFGVYDVNSPADDRAYWYGAVSNYLEANNVAWTIWDYHGGFGLFNKNSNGMFYHDLNVPVCDALGLTAPAQTPFVAKPDSTGFEVFSDYMGKDINNASYANGDLSFYSANNPNNGKYCIQWSGATQYQSIVFDFKPDKDLSKLVDTGYALDMIIRGTDPNGSLDIRFVDTKTGDGDHPWRNRIIANKAMVEWDGQWQHLHVSLSDFKEHGSWDNAWYNPEGLFDWTAVDKLEIVTEAQSMSKDGVFGFDNIFITDQDTATVKYFESPVDTTGNGVIDLKIKFVAVTNDFNRSLITLKSEPENSVTFQLVYQTGRIEKFGRFEGSYQISTNDLPTGIYVIWMKSDNKIQTQKLAIRRN